MKQNFKEILGLTDKHVKATLADLENTGVSFSGRTFSKGDVIEFAPENEMSFWMFAFREGTNPAAQTNVSINDGVSEVVAFGSFRRVPHGKFGEAFLAQHEVNNDLKNCQNDSVLARKLAGKRIRVADVVEDRKALWTRNEGGGREMARDANGEVKTCPADFYVWEWVD